MSRDDLQARLAELPAHDVDPHVAERIRRRALAVLAEERPWATRPWFGEAARLWTDLIEPAVTGGVVALYLAWLIPVLRPLL